MRDKGLGVAVSGAILVFVLMFAFTDGFAGSTQELVASSDVTVRSTAPTVNDDLDFNFQAGYIWIDAVGGAVYIAESVADGAAVWTDITAGGSTFNGEEEGSLVVSNVGIINFGPGFDLVDNGGGELAVTYDYTENTVDLASADITGLLDISSNTNLGATTGITLTGDTLTLTNDFGASIDSSEITDGTISEVDLKVVNAATDEYCLTYEVTTGDFEWQVCGGGGGGTLTTIKEGDAQIGDADIVTLDFGAGFDCTESPDTEINCLLDYSEDPVALGSSDVSGTLAAGSGGLGQTSATADGVPVGNGTGFTLRVLSDCVAAGDAVTYNASTDQWGCATGYLTAVTSANITDNEILEADLKAVNAATDEFCLTYESTGGDFEWQTCSPGGGGGTVTTVKWDDVQLGDADIVTLDFGVGLTCTETPDTEINCTVDLGESVDLTSEVTGTLPLANGGTGLTAAVDDAVMVGNGSAWTSVTLTDCDAAGNAVNYDTTTNAWSCRTGFLTTVSLTTDVSGTLPVGNGGTGLTTAAADVVIVGNGSAFVARTLPSCSGATGALLYNNTTDTFTCGTGYLKLTGVQVPTGSFDFGGATYVEVPNGAGGTTVAAAGRLTVDTTTGTLNFHNGTAERSLQPLRQFAITFEDPTSSEDLSIWHVNFAITVTREMCVLNGSATPSVTVTLRHGTDRSAAGAELNTSGNAITSTTTGNEDVAFADATIVADSFIWLETTAQSGTVDALSCTWEYTIDA